MGHSGQVDNTGSLADLFTPTIWFLLAFMGLMLVVAIGGEC